jgi:hypothetical protein
MITNKNIIIILRINLVQNLEVKARVKVKTINKRN